ncbi:MAG TPA: hypothetical protein VEF33_06290 [Syntrophales bacterium]|nr:hypothetical protein [Syntrophales bacterium]
MKDVFTAFLIFSLVISLGGCAGSMIEINAKSQSTKSNVFVENPDSETPLAGYADLVIKIFLKTPPAGYYLWEPRDSFSGKL